MRTLPSLFGYPAIALAALIPLLAPPLSHAQVRISEFMASNVSGIQDEDGAFSDWIEIHNAGSNPVDLEGWHLTDNATTPAQWTFPATNLPAGGFLLVFASGKDRAAPRLHANFSLSADGEYLALVRPDGTTVEHAYAPAFPEQFPDISYGLQTHGTNPSLRAGQAGYLIYRTPGTTNSCLPAPHPAYSEDSVARIDLGLSQDTWNWLMWDNPETEVYRSINLRFRHGDIDVTVTNVGIQCRGNTSLTKHPRSFNIAFDAFVPDQTLFGLERLNLNGDVNDPSMARSKLLNDLSNATGLPTSYANHAAVVISNTTSGVSYFEAIRDNSQAVDDVFLTQRFGNKRGNLYKCNHREWEATLEKRYPSVGSSYIGNGTTYDLKYAGAGDTSYNDLASFINLINDTAASNFPNAIMEAFDVDGFLQHMALDVLAGNWDNYWSNGNNYHLFLHPDTHRWIYIPYDFDNTLGVSWDYGAVNWATRSIYNWPNYTGNTPLATKIMAVPEFRNRYSFYMKQILNTVYSNSLLRSSLYFSRSNMSAPLPFQEVNSVTNMKVAEKNFYAGWGTWNWTYDHFWYSFDSAQYSFNWSLPAEYRDVGITDFISTRRSSALSQLGTVSNIAPILSGFSMTPQAPRSNDSFSVSIQAIDDVAVTNVAFFYSFNGGATNEVPMALQTNGLYAATVPAMGATGTLRYLVRALDNTGRSTTHPYGGTAYAGALDIANSAVQLVVTELNYNPYALSAAETNAGITDKEYFEFIELYNAGSAPLDLTGYKFTAGIGGTFPAFILTNGTYAVAVKNTNAFRIRYTNTAIRIITTFSGNLSNGGETVRLENAQSGVIANIPYGDKGDWPGRADGDGSSLELIDPATPEYDDPFAWRSSSEYGGTPGAAGLGPDNRIVVNEVLTHTDPPLSDSIELLNTTAGAISIGGWVLSDSKTNYRKYAIPAGTILPAGGYIVFNETNHFNTSGGSNPNDFSLDGAHGENVYLLQTDSRSNLVRFADRAEFGPAANGESFGRWPNGTGRLYPMASRTFGSANSGPRTGPVFIGELMYNPPSGSNHLAFIEIQNPTDSTVDLTRWQLSDGISFAFPSNTLLPAGGVLAVLPFDPNAPANSALLADFTATYALTGTVSLVGGFSGTLSDAGERVRLLRPDDPPAEEPTFYPMLIEDEVAYGTDLPWPAEANGGGYSLERLSPAAWGDSYTSWTAILPPTPGQPSTPIPTFSLTVISPHGTPSPSVGTHPIPVGTTISNSVSSPDTQGSTRYLCTGWTLEGNDPAVGTTNWMSMVLTNDATLAWQWTTQFLASISADPGGSVQPSTGWHPAGVLAEFVAAPSNSYFFAGWTGDTNAIVSGTLTSATISVRMDTPVSLTAHFEEIPIPSNRLEIVSAHGSPSPSVGAHRFATGSTISNSVFTPVISGHFQYLCTGWTLDNHDPASGSASAMTLTLTNDATLTWLWTTQVEFSVSADPGGSVSPTSGWHTPGTNFILQAEANSGYEFTGWTGDTHAILSGNTTSSTVIVGMSAPVSLHATFVAILPTYYVSPDGTHTAPYTNWTSASTSLSAMVSYAPAGSTVLVASATYPLQATLTIAKALHLKSANGPGETILDGGNSVRILFLSHAEAIVEGFTLQHGNSGSSSGGGVRIEPDGQLRNCILRNNTSQKYGGGAALLGGGTLRNCLLHGNSATEWGGGIYTYTTGNTPLIESTTVARNSAGEGGGLYLNQACRLLNSVTWGNSSSISSNILLFGSGHAVQSSLTNTSPLFVNSTSNDFRLSPSSPAINAGTNQPWMSTTLDLDSRPRILYETTDLGAYEGFLDTVDSDSDKLGDWQEILAGTDPFNPDSFLGIGAAATSDDPARFVLRWSSVTGRSYRITISTNLLSGFPVAAYSNIPAAPPVNTYTGTLDPAGLSYYRIELE